MCIQACTSSSKHLPIGDSMLIDPEWIIRLEAKYYSKTNIFGGTKAFKRWAKYLKSCTAIAADIVQDKQIGVL